jgi:hypothetical protein
MRCLWGPARRDSEGGRKGGREGGRSKVRGKGKKREYRREARPLKASRKRQRQINVPTV